MLEAPIFPKQPQRKSRPRAHAAPTAIVKKTMSASTITPPARARMPSTSASPASSSIHGSTIATAFSVQSGAMR